MNNLFFFILVIVIILINININKINENFNAETMGVYNYFYQLFLNPYYPKSMNNFFSNDNQKII